MLMDEYVVVGNGVVCFSCPKIQNESSTKALAVDGKANDKRIDFNLLFLRNNIAIVAIIGIIDPVAINAKIVGHENDFESAF